MPPKNRNTEKRQQKQNKLHTELNTFFEDDKVTGDALAILHNKVYNGQKISMRLLEFACTNPMACEIIGEPDWEEFQCDFQQEAAAYGKMFFDCFKRQGKVLLTNKGKSIMQPTSIGQLNFLRFLLQKKDRLNTIVKHAEAINDEILKQDEINRLEKKKREEDPDYVRMSPTPRVQKRPRKQSTQSRNIVESKPLDSRVFSHPIPILFS
jgi:hypothetical protein